MRVCATILGQWTIKQKARQSENDTRIGPNVFAAGYQETVHGNLQLEGHARGGFQFCDDGRPRKISGAEPKRRQSITPRKKKEGERCDGRGRVFVRHQIVRCGVELDCGGVRANITYLDHGPLNDEVFYAIPKCSLTLFASEVLSQRAERRLHGTCGQV
jgi:hypothetical protein